MPLSNCKRTAFACGKFNEFEDMDLYFADVYYHYHNVYILYMIIICNMKITNSNKTSIGVTRETLEKLTDAKFDFRVNSIEDVIEILLKERENDKKEVPA